MAQSSASTRPLVRSLLFIPATKLHLEQKAVDCGADAIIWDLEDAVVDSAKDEARHALGAYLRQRASRGPAQFVRINSLDTSRALSDLTEITCRSLAGVYVPKVNGPRDVELVDRLLNWLEHDNGIPAGSICIVPVLETAAGIRASFDVAGASPRVAFMGGLGVLGGDIERAIGYRWSAAGTETLVMRSQALLDARAAGVHNPITGMWVRIDDLDGLREFANQGRDLGYEGMMAIHPSHIPIINEVFGDSGVSLARDRRLIETLRAASGGGEGAVTFEGVMIDKAMHESAAERLRRAGDVID